MFKILLFSAFVFFHPVHVTLTSLNKEQGNDTLKMSFRMYYEDFLLDYRLFKPGFEAGKIADPEDYFKKNIEQYFNDRVQLYINRKLLPCKLSELTINNYEILLSLTCLTGKPPGSIRIKNQILTGIYSDQANLVYLKIDKYENAVKLTTDKAEAFIKIK